MIKRVRTYMYVYGHTRTVSGNALYPRCPGTQTRRYIFFENMKFVVFLFNIGICYIMQFNMQRMKS